MVGQHIGKYRVTEQIGRGGMGTVYRAVDETLDRDVAIKVLNAGLNDPTVARRFRAEAVTIARLNHPGIATIYELVQHDGQWLMVMEYVRGETLERVVADQGPLPVERAADMLMQMLSALAHAHGLGVVHRDLKPANLMLTAGGGLKIMDFGIARVAGAEQLTTAGFMMGTPAYMAPEQVLGQDIDARTDLYAAGLVFYHLMTGRLPFKGETPIQMAQARVNATPTPVRMARSDVPEWVGHVLEIVLAKEPTHRFQTALLFREAIRRGLANLPIEVPVPSALPPELVATAAPGDLRTSEVSIWAKPKPTSPPAADLPTTAAASPVPPQDRGTQAAGDTPVRASGNRWLFVAAGVLLVVGGLAAWMMSRGGAEPAPDIPIASSEPSAPAEAAAVDLQDAADVSHADVPEPQVIAPPPVESAPMASSTPSLTPAASPAAAPPQPSTPALSAPAASVETASPSPTARPAAAAAAPGADAETPVSFRDVRGFLVTGRRVDERSALLTFADGRVSLTDERGGTRYASLPYSQITSAVYTRGRNPRWYPTLAGPPADLEMPGGLFRGDRYWLVLQSRSDYLIVRMNDGDWRRIVAAVTNQIGLNVSELSQ